MMGNVAPLKLAYVIVNQTMLGNQIVQVMIIMMRHILTTVKIFYIILQNRMDMHR